MNYRDADNLVAKDLASAALLQAWVENIQRTGSFSDRRPDLGKMYKCGFCGRRHRMIGPRCSNVPGETFTTYPDAVTYGLAVTKHEVEVSVACR